MKIIHTSDWHLGQSFYNYDREEEHRRFFGLLAGYMTEHRPDALVVSGDVFHTAAPSAQAMRLFVDGVMGLHDASPKTVIVITAGNHDSGSRLDAERELWRRLGIHVVGTCTRGEDGVADVRQFVVEVPGKGYVLAVPYFHPSNFPLTLADVRREERQREFFTHLLAEVAESELPVVMLAHLAVQGCDIRGHEDVPVGGMLTEELDALGAGYDYLALGHIHKPQCIAERVYYSGSPIPLSFSEDYTHYVNLVEISAHGAEPTVTRLEVPTLRHVTTVPPKGAPLEEALAALEALDDKADCYVRVLVDQDDPIDADADSRARKAAEGKACRYCEVRRKPHEVAAGESFAGGLCSLADLDHVDPLEIALGSYKRQQGSEMDTEIVDMLRKVIDMVRDEEAREK